MQSRRLRRRVSKLMRGVGRNVDGGWGSHGLLDAAKGDFEFAFEHGECFVKVVAMWRWAAAGRHVHIDEAEAPGGVFPA